MTATEREQVEAAVRSAASALPADDLTDAECAAADLPCICGCAAEEHGRHLRAALLDCCDHCDGTYRPARDRICEACSGAGTTDPHVTAWACPACDGKGWD